MQIARNAVVRIDYTLTDDQSTVIDSSDGGEPLAYLHGAGNIISGLESALEGRKAGDKLNVRVSPAEGYGERNDALVAQVPRERFDTEETIEVGQQFHTMDEEGGVQVVTVTAVDAQQVTIDGNHPLAGVELNFAVTIVEVRAATAEELEHGHVHGAGGHEH